MQQTLPLFLYEAMMTLWPAAAGGTSIGGNAIWWAGPANRLTMRKENIGVLMAASGDNYQTEHQYDENHRIEVAQTWLTRRDGTPDFGANRGSQYILQLLWQETKPPNRGPGALPAWMQRTYYGVTCQSLGWESAGVLESAKNLVFRAQYLDDAIGTGTGSGFIPLPPIPGTPQTAGYFLEEPMAAGAYLLGYYRYAAPVTLQSANAVAWASQNTATVLGLEINGLLTGETLTLPVGAANTEVTAQCSLSDTVPAGQAIRWKVISGPADVESMGWHCAVGMDLIS